MKLNRWYIPQLFDLNKTDINKKLMDNLIDVKSVKPRNFLSLAFNKIKVNVVVCIFVILLNGVPSGALAGDMLTIDIHALSPRVCDSVRQNGMDSISNAISHIPSFAGDVSSGYGTRRHPITGRLKKHRGIDIRMPRNTPIYAPANGVILFSGWRRGFGNVIEIDHGNGYVTLIAHNTKNFVKAGQTVTRSTLIGTVGATGWATGPHMHVELSLNGKLIDPSPFIQQNVALR